MNRFQTIRRSDDPDLESIYEEIVDHGFGEERPVNWFFSQSMRWDILATTWALGKDLMPSRCTSHNGQAIDRGSSVHIKQLPLL